MLAWKLVHRMVKPPETRTEVHFHPDTFTGWLSEVKDGSQNQVVQVDK